MKAEFKELSDGLFETTCVGCGEPLLMKKGDQMHIRVDETKDGGTEVAGVLCAICYRSDRGKNIDFKK